jgi:hypothetical protein
VKVTIIIESLGYETLIVDELFSKLKSTEIDYQTQAKLENPSAPTMALVSGNGSSSLVNPSQMSFALSSLVSVTEEQLESLGDDELALIINRFSRFLNNRLNCQHGGGPKEGCYGCGDPDHFVTHYPKKNKHSFDKYDSSKRKDKRGHTSSKHKSKGGFDKEAIKEFLKKAKAHKHAFLDCLSDLEKDSTDRDSSTSSDNESKRKIKDKLSGLCFHTDTTKQGLCTMALSDEVEAGKGKVEIGKDEASSDDDTSQVSLSTHELAIEVETLSVALINQDKLLLTVLKYQI